MIVKLFNSSNDLNFGAVQYNEDKIDKGYGELILHNNFPEYVNVNDKEVVKKFLQNIKPTSSKAKNLQFHAVISANGKEHSKEVLSKIAEDFMKNMGYDKQPYLVVFHNDTKNNHIHIVSTNVNMYDRNMISDKFSKLRSQVAILEAQKNILGIDYDKKLERLINYKGSNINQLEKLLLVNGYDSSIKNDKVYIYKNGIELKNIELNKLNISDDIDKNRAKQIKEILLKYKDTFDNNVFKIVDEDKLIKHYSVLQKELKTKFGFDIQFSFSDNKNPFGYILIDNKTNQIFKGSDVVQLNNLFKFTDIKIDKSVFEILENSLLKKEEEKIALKFYLENKFNFKADDFLFDFGKKIPFSEYKSNRSLIQGFCKGVVNDTMKFNKDFVTIKIANDYYLINEKDKYVFNLREVLNENYYNKFENTINNVGMDYTSSSSNNNHSFTESINNNKNEMSLISSIANEISKANSVNSDENPNQRKRKKRFKR